jgi:hypothetical protein
MSYDFKNYEKNQLTRPRDEAWGNWKSWKESAPGELVQGYVADAFFRPEEKNPDGSIAFRSQRGITIKQPNGELINVGIKDFDFILKSTDGLRVGDPITIRYEKTEKPKMKGQNGAKVFSYFGTNLPENEANPTVKELTDEDRLAGGSELPEGEKTEDEIKNDEAVEAF